MRRISLLLLGLSGCPACPPSPTVDGGAQVVDSGPPAPPPVTCTPTQCQAIHAASGGYCGEAAPLGCTTTGGCYSSTAAAQAGCPDGWCSTASCSAIPQPQRASRNVIFQNNCSESLSIYVTDPSPGSNPHPYCDGGASCLLFPVKAGGWGVFNVSLMLNDAGGFYGMPAGGIALWAMPDDGDTADTTLFEVNFGAFGGTADSYYISAIPPGSCSGHVQSPSNDLGYADHLPRKNPADPTQSWACLKLLDGGPNPATCGDGLGHLLCPEVSYGTPGPAVHVAALSTTLTQEIVAPAGSSSIAIQTVTCQSTTSTASKLAIGWGTGTNCGTGTGAGPVLVCPPNTVEPAVYQVMVQAPPAEAVCLACDSATNTCKVDVDYVTVGPGDLPYGTIKPLTAVPKKNTGCGVPGETCYFQDGGISDGGCCPNICAVAQDQNATDPTVRTEIYECAHAQGLLTGTGRRTGYWTSMRVDPVLDGGCRMLRCIVPDGGDASTIGQTCEGYLFPYDDAEAAATCGATPDYRVTFCP